MAQNQLVLTKENVATLSLQVKNLRHALKAKQADLLKAQQDYERYVKLFKNHYIAQQMVQHAKASLEVSQADVAQAEIALHQAEQTLGKNIDGVNVHVRLAEAKNQLAQFYLNKTQVRAPTNGYVENLYVHKGNYAAPGDTQIPFIIANSWWIEGLVPENGIKNIQQGQKALVVLDLYPGHLFDATVTSVGHGVQVAAIKPTGDLPTYSDTN